jgi:hypothetical protein
MHQTASPSGSGEFLEARAELTQKDRTVAQLKYVDDAREAPDNAVRLGEPLQGPATSA